MHVSGEALVRLGYLSKATVYLLVGALALRVAAGAGGGQLTDRGGALYVILQKPLGNTMLFLIAIGLLAYATWRIGGVIFGWRPRIHGAPNRVFAGLRALVYALTGWQAMRLAVGLYGGGGGPETLARDALQWPFGQWLVVGCGAAIAWYGVVEIRDAYKGILEPGLDGPTLRASAGAWALNVARAGIGARALVLVLIGYGLARAGLARSPSRAGDMGESFAVLNALPEGSLVLGATAIGIIAYGIYQLLHARYARL